MGKGKPKYEVLEAKVKRLSAENRYLRQLIKQYNHLNFKDIPFLEIIPQMVSYTNKDLRYEYVNKAYERFFNIKTHQIIGKKLVDIIGEDVLKKAKVHIDKVLKGQGVEYLEKFEYPNDVTMYVKGQLIPDITKNGDVKGYWAILSDITEIIKTEEIKKKLVNEAVFIDRKLKLFHQMETELKSILKKNNYDFAKFAFIFKFFRNKTEHDKHWQVFKENFGSLHPGFFDKLTALSPRLSQQDIKHCAYIKMNFETKEIAAIFNVKPSSVQMARVRLKKKLGLKPEKDLVKYILQL